MTRPGWFVHRGIPVGSITGFISRPRCLAWQSSGDLGLSTLSKLLRGPAVVYVALVEDSLVVAVGARARRQVEELLDCLMRERTGGNHHLDAISDLAHPCVASVSFDLAELLLGTREAAPYWHPEGAKLRNLEIAGRLPVAATVTTEPGALRVSVRIPAADLAALTRQVLERLADGR
jgi:hypothetical protein